MQTCLTPAVPNVCLFVYIPHALDVTPSVTRSKRCFSVEGLRVVWRRRRFLYKRVFTNVVDHRELHEFSSNLEKRLT